MKNRTPSASSFQQSKVHQHLSFFKWASGCETDSCVVDVIGNGFNKQDDKFTYETNHECREEKTDMVTFLKSIDSQPQKRSDARRRPFL